jgi:hypothetical protein
MIVLVALLVACGSPLVPLADILLHLAGLCYLTEKRPIFALSATSVSNFKACFQMSVGI